MHRSHLTQQLQNYFDENDTRARELPNTLEAQLLNAAALMLEDNAERVRREGARSLAGVPLNLDNRGVYHRVQIPASFPGAGLTAPLVDAWTGAEWKRLHPYDDFLPVPSAIELDPARSALPLESPVLFDVTGTGLPISVAGFSLSVPNRIYFWVSGLEHFNGAISIQLSGDAHPQVCWADGSAKRTENVLLYEEGRVRIDYQGRPEPAETSLAWTSVDGVEIRNLPEGARLQAVLFPFTFSHTPDPWRPYTSPAFRDVLYPRYWTIEGGLLKEVFPAGRSAGYDTIQSYSLPSAMTGVEVEPNTRGMLVYSSSKVYYADRREPRPGNLTTLSLLLTAINLLRKYGFLRGTPGPRASDHLFCLARPNPTTTLTICFSVSYLIIWGQTTLAHIKTYTNARFATGPPPCPEMAVRGDVLRVLEHRALRMGSISASCRTLSAARAGQVDRRGQPIGYGHHCARAAQVSLGRPRHPRSTARR